MGFEKEPFFKLFKDNPDITYQASGSIPTRTHCSPLKAAKAMGRVGAL